MLFGEAKCANLGRPNVSILGVANVLRPSDTQSAKQMSKGADAFAKQMSI